MKKSLLFNALILGFLFLSGQSFSQCDINGPTSLEPFMSIKYSTADIPGASYFWSVTGPLGISSSSNTNSSIYIYGNNNHGGGIGEVCVTRFQEGEQPCCECIEVEVVPPCTPATGVEIEYEGCQGDEITFTATLSPSNVTLNEANFTWTAGTGAPGTGLLVTQDGGSEFTWNVPNTPPIWVTVTYVSCDGSLVTDTEIIDCCIPATGIKLQQVGFPCLGQPVTFQAFITPVNATIINNNIQWLGGTGTMDNPLATFSATGGLSFTFLTDGVVDEAWCSVEYTDCEGNVHTHALNVIFLNCFGNGNTSGGEEILNPNGELDDSITPNPFSEETTLVFTLEEEEKLQVEVFNLNGAVLFSKEGVFEAGKNEVHIKGIPVTESGVFYYRIKNNHGTLNSGKMLRLGQ